MIEMIFWRIIGKKICFMSSILRSFAILFFFHLLVIPALGSKKSTNPYDCDWADVAILFDQLVEFDEVHNCQINVRIYEQTDKSNSQETIWLYHQIWIRDNYLCRLQPKKCEPQIFEFKLPKNCLDTKLERNKNFKKKRIHSFPQHKIMTFVDAQFDHYGNLMFLNIGEKSNQSMTTNQMVCKTKIFGEIK